MLVFVLIILETFGASLNIVEGKPRRILLDTDVDTDDLFALLYLLKLNRLEFQLEVSETNQIEHFFKKDKIFFFLACLIICICRESL